MSASGGTAEKKNEPKPNGEMTKPFTTKFSVPELLNHLRTLALRHDEVGQEIVLNEILRQLIDRKEFEQAELIVTKTQLTQPYRSPNQAARFYYYVGLTKAIRLDYTDASNCISQALRKAPERANGFRIAATKLYLTIQLLIGEIPPRAEFLDPNMKEALYPYMLLTSCVRFANLGRFISLLKQYQDVLEHDHTYTLLVRVRQNVIKTGLRRICAAYSSISLPDICVRLALENTEDIEYIVGKAIRDGVIEATIDSEKKIVTTSDTVDVYRTTEPMQAFQRRIAFLSSTYEEAKRAMRYVDSVEPEIEEERTRKAQSELALLAMEDFDDFTEL